MRRGVFLDRDGTLIEEAGYLDRLERLQFYPYTVDAVRLLNQADLAVVVATNQSGVARGLVEQSFIGKAHDYISERLADGGARVDAWYYCPHHPEGRIRELAQTCECRKPRPGMLLRAAADLQLDLRRCFAVGDRPADVESANAAGATPILVRTGYGRATEGSLESKTMVVDNLIEAVSWILQRS